MPRKQVIGKLSEISVRIACPNCKGATDVSIVEFKTRFADGQCLVCKKLLTGFGDPNSQNLLHKLAQALDAVNSSPGADQVEFVLSDPEEMNPPVPSPKAEK